MATENSVAETFLYSSLNVAGLTALLTSPATITYAEASQATTGTFVIFEQVSGIDHNVQDQLRGGTEMRYIVSGVAENSRAMPGAVAAKIDELLHNKVSTAQTGYVVNCWRHGPYTWSGSKHGRNFRHEGGIYTIWVRSTS